MPPRDVRAYLGDIRTAIDEIEMSVAGLDFTGYQSGIRRIARRGRDHADRRFSRVHVRLPMTGRRFVCNT